MKKIHTVGVFWLILIFLSFQLISSKADINSKINFESGWIQRNEKNRLDIYIKDDLKNIVSPSNYNLTVYIKKGNDLTDKCFNQTTIIFVESESHFKIIFQTNYNLTLSYSLYLFLTFDDFHAESTGGVNEIVLVEPNTVFFSFNPGLLSFLTIFLIKKRTISKKLI
jgi:hypothetical protein